MFPKDMPPLEESVSVFKDLPESDRDLAGFLSRGQKVSFGGVMYNTGEQLAEIEASTSDDLKHHWMRVNRADFRQWLYHGLEINWNKKLVNYEQSSTGVTAHFADGTSTTGDILIACDGAHSPCRKQLLGPENSRTETATVGALTANFQAATPQYRELLSKGPAFLTATSPKYHFFLGPRKWVDGRAEYYWSVTWDDQAFDLMKEHSCSDPGEGARQQALELCSDLHPSLRKLIEDTRPSQMLDSGPQLLQFAPEKDRLGGERVTLVGDALHTMVPFRGGGANTALLDVFDIAKLMIHAVKEEKDIKSVIPIYESVATPRGRAMKQFSKDASLHPDPGHWAETMKFVYARGYEWEEINVSKKV